MRTPTLLPFVALAACQPGDDAVGPDPYALPDGVTASLYAPDDAFLTFPDLAQTELDATTATGLRVKVTDGARADLAGKLPPGFNLFEALEELDGFGLTGGVTLRFSAAVDPATIATATRWVRLADDGSPTAVADVGFEAWSTDEGRTVVLDPLFPLDPATRYAVVVDRPVLDAAGGEVWPAPDLHRQLWGQEGDAAPHVLQAWADARVALGVEADDVAAGTVFTTQSARAQDEEVRDLLLARDLRLERDGDCVFDGTITTCPATLVAADPTGEDRTLGADETPSIVRTYTLKVDVHLPGDGSLGPFPVAMFGHGLAGDRGEARGFARQVASDRIAVVGVDAPDHGDHPTAVYSDVFAAMAFFGVDLTAGSFDVLRLRDNWRLAAWDKLQVAEAIRAGFDADGDGEDDFAPGDLHWAGHSLGAVMGSQLVAMDDSFASAYLSVPGGRVSDIVHRGELFAPLIYALAPEGSTPGDIDRFFPVLQAAIDRGEPATWAPFVRQGTRQVFMQMVIDDDIIPNACSRYLARALTLDLVGEVFQPVEGLNHVPGDFPVKANQGGATRALLQLDDMVDEGTVVDAIHTHVFGSETNERLLHGWFEAVLGGEAGVVVDPEVP